MLKNKFLLLSILILSFTSTSCSTFYLSKKSDAGVMVLNSETIAYEDSIVNAMILPYKQALEAEMEEIIGYSERHLHKANPEGLLNNLIADIVLYETNKIAQEKEMGITIDFAILNNGGLRAPLPEGAIRVRNIYEIMPFDNEIVILKLSPEKTKSLFNYVAQQKGVPISGATLGINKDDNAVNILINGKPFDNTRSYYVATSDYLAAGGDKMKFFDAPESYLKTYYLMRDAIINYIKMQNGLNKIIDSKLDKRVYFE